MVGASLLTLRVGISASLLASVAGIPLAFLLALSEFRGKGAILTLVQTLMAVPTVIVGLVLYGLLSRSGPLGFLDLLFTPGAMIAGDFILAVPVVLSLAVAAVQAVDRRVEPTALSLGATRPQLFLKVLSEARFAIATAVVAGLGRAVAEVGCAFILGGNIRGATRTLTTAIALETGKGEFAEALALGIILLVLALGLNAILRVVQGAGEK